MVKIHYLTNQKYQRMLLQKGHQVFQSEGSIFYEMGFRREQLLKDYQYDALPYPKEALSAMMDIWQNTLEEEAKEKELPELIKPSDLWIVDGMLKGQTMPKLSSDWIDFEDFIFSRQGNLEEICQSFQPLSELFERGIRLNYVFLDAITKGNLKIHKQTKKICLIDGEGIQANFQFPFIASSLLNIDENQKMMDHYFVSTDAYMYAKPTLNRAAFWIYFIKLCTQYVCLTDVYPTLNSKETIEMILEHIGLREDTIVAPILRTLLEGEIEKSLSSQEWEEFAKTYQLVPKSYDSKGSVGYRFQKI